MVGSLDWYIFIFLILKPVGDETESENGVWLEPNCSNAGWKNMRPLRARKNVNNNGSFHCNSADSDKNCDSFEFFSFSI